MTKIKRGLALFLAAVLAMSAAGCSQTESSAPAESGASGAAEQGESQGEAQGEESSGDEDYIIIGSVNDLSGNRSVNGNAINNGVKLAVDEINAAGGVLGRQLKLITYDNKNDSQESINAYTRLADLDKACAVITSDASSVCLSLVEISNQKKVPLMGMPSDPRAVMNPDTGEVYPYMFLVDQPNAPQQANIMAKYIEANTDLRKAAVFYDQSNAYTVTNSEAFIDIWNEIGEVVIVETCNANDQDYRTQLNKIKNSGAEFIYCPNMPSQLVIMVQQAVQSGLDIPYMGAMDMADPFLSLLNDPSTLSLAYFQAVCWMEDEKIQPFFEAYKEAYGEDPIVKSVNGYDAMYILKAAIEKAGSDDPEAIRDALENDISGLQLLVSDDYAQDPATHSPLNLGMVMCKIEKGELSNVGYFLPEE